MIDTIKGRVKELENIRAIKAKMPNIKRVPVKIDYHTIILVKEGTDIEKAVEEFKLKVSEAFKKELSRGGIKNR